MPRVVDHVQRRRDLARAACAVIARAGIDGTTLRDVAAEAGCTTGMVSHYFTSKDELLVAALDAATAAVGERIVARVLADPHDLRAVLAESLPLDDTRRAEWRVWMAFWGSTVGNPALRREDRGAYAVWRSALDAVLAGTGWPGATRIDAAESLMLAVDGIGLHATLDPDGWPPERQLDHLDRAVLALQLDGR